MKLIQEIARDLSMSEGDISRIISNAPRRYKVFNILKRGGGIRIIAQPARELKDIQRYLVAKKLRTLPIHRAAMAYVRGKNIQQNAQVHAKRRVILKLDFKGHFEL